MAHNARRVNAGEEEIDPLDFDELLSEKMKMLGMEKKYKERNLNDGFSGGEKKKNEILQMAILEPKLSILDETDSGLDIDALRIVAEGVNKFRNENNALILITHYQRLLDYIKPDFVHVLSKGKIIKSGDKALALELESQGYDWVTSSN
jgi:Fe-S cluster assembly ATP-binding protein